MRPLILGQDFSIHTYVGCEWTTRGTNELKVKCRVIMEVEEPEAGKFFSIKKEIHVLPRHYAVTQIKCNRLKNAVTIRPDKEFKRENPSMKIDTYYVDPY